MSSWKQADLPKHLIRLTGSTSWQFALHPSLQAGHLGAQAGLEMPWPKSDQLVLSFKVVFCACDMARGCKRRLLGGTQRVP